MSRQKSYFKSLASAYVTREGSNTFDFCTICRELLRTTEGSRDFHAYAVEVSNDGIILGVYLAGIYNQMNNRLDCVDSFSPDIVRRGHMFIVYPTVIVLEQALNEAWMETLGVKPLSAMCIVDLPHARPERLQLNATDMLEGQLQIMLLGHALAGTLPVKKEVYGQNPFIDGAEEKEALNG